jgi:hypothetical protein
MNTRVTGWGPIRMPWEQRRLLKAAEKARKSAEELECAAIRAQEALQHNMLPHGPLNMEPGEYYRDPDEPEQPDEIMQRMGLIPIELVASLIDRDPCWFDHHGGCQAHGYLSLEPGEKCPQQEAKEWLKAHGEEI